MTISTVFIVNVSILRYFQIFWCQSAVPLCFIVYFLGLFSFPLLLNMVDKSHLQPFAGIGPSVISIQVSPAPFLLKTKFVKKDTEISAFSEVHVHTLSWRWAEMSVVAG